ncbi:15.4 kDa class V heat shock protein [Dendrobium catenatum]|uniref:15.4 kDa class V heat shock protein n=1 Tax=Dendrobium catenatum TaxID=906689 RepID=A0A2I0VQ24_9ASPA|nr:15.4 kDa class V heat shock protein [Dendrobium catenatum]PKU65516.1 15.4 kDa class V heat shock protein [Dendrobium catenatum]
MELYRIHGSPWPIFFPMPLLFRAQSHANNNVRWIQTPDSYLLSADLPGVRIEEVRVELEDSRYLVIRTELSSAEGGDDRDRRGKEFMKKFRLPAMVNVEGISAAYENSLLTVLIPRTIVAAVAAGRWRLRIDLASDEVEEVLRGAGAARAA